tara:strand:- start:54 stop:509 length:456 start_codon:yes stop_codon:yes gene_type:complete
MDINKIINIVREQRTLKEFGLPPGAPGLGGGGGGTNVITSQAKVRSLGAMLTDPTGKKAERKFHNDPQSYLTDADYQNRNKNLPPKKERKSYKFEEVSMGPTNAVGAPPAPGQPAKIAGIHGDPPMRKNKNKKYAYGGPGSRKLWMSKNVV